MEKDKKKHKEQNHKKSSSKEKSRGASESSYVPKKVEQNEEKQLLWFFLVLLVIFASFLGPYYYLDSLKKFEFVGIPWQIEEYSDLTVYHGRFPQILNNAVMYNIYLRVDPRENDISSTGDFNSFYPTVAVSFGRAIDDCQGEISRAVFDLGNFLSDGIGISKVVSATSDLELAEEQGKTYMDCSTVPDGTTLISIEKGEGHWVSQSVTNPDCFTIRVNSCEDSPPIEKFMLEVIDAFYGQDSI